MTSAANNQLKQSNFLINNKQTEQLSFFEHNYKSYRPFARLTKKIGFDNSFNFGSKSKFSIDQHKYGDLITNIIVQLTVPTISDSTTNFFAEGGTNYEIGYTNALGHAIFESVELKINGQLIDKHESEWNNIWSELTIRPGVQKNYNFLVKKFSTSAYNNFQGGDLYIPLQFWFCQNSSSNNTKNNMVLPLVTLYNSTIELIFNIRTFNDLFITRDNKQATSGGVLTTASTPNITNANILIDYIILQDKERKKLQKIDIDRYYLITQIQEHSVSIESNQIQKKITLEMFKYPISEIIWIVQLDEAINKNFYFSYGSSIATNAVDPISTTSIKFDGIERLEELNSEYFHKVETFMIHDNTPFSFIHCYSFALSPENFSQPSGICNFSEIHTPELDLKFINNVGASKIKIFGINYNVLKIKNGEGILLQSLSKSSLNKSINDLNLIPGP